MYGLPFVELENKNYGKRKRGTLRSEKMAYFRWLILGRALELCGTGKHPNMNVETQIPLELANRQHATLPTVTIYNVNNKPKTHFYHTGILVL